MIPGIVPKFLKFSFCLVDSVYMTVCFRNRNFTPKSFAIIAGALIIQNQLLTVPNLMNEHVQNLRRLNLAK